MDKKILALIPARVGSKKIPKKNIIDINGHPLLAYSIAAAKLSKHINRIIVSTDSEEFAEIARSYGAETPFIRPAEHSQDWSADKPYYKHALDWLKEKEGYVPDLVVNLRPTAPVRMVETTNKAILEMINDEKATAVRTGHLMDHTSYKTFRKDGDYMKFFGAEDFEEGVEFYDMCRQTVPTTYTINGSVDVLDPKVLRETGMVHGKYMRCIPIKKVADVDAEEDLEFAKRLLKQKEYLPLLNLLNEIKRTGS